jgi:hypothetical protein
MNRVPEDIKRKILSTAVRISDDIFDDAKKVGKKHLRSAAKQVEFWARVGRAAIDNPDLPVSFVADILEAKEQKSEPFEFQHE